MPHYDESFINVDNQNQKRNKRSYHFYKNSLNPLSFIENNEAIHVLEGTGTSMIKRNIRNIKTRGNRYKPDAQSALQSYNSGKSKIPDLIVDHYPGICALDTSRYYDIQNNNIVPLTPCKSFDNLTLKKKVRRNDLLLNKIRSGTSLQNLADEEKLKLFVSPLEDCRESRKDDGKNSYSVVDGCFRSPQRRISRTTPAPGVGTYRQINNDGVTRKFVPESEACGDSGSGHRGSLRGANKLARRARSFKDDLLERISNMRSPAQQHHPPHLSSGIRSNSPLSPKIRNMGTKTTTEEGEITPAKELERLVKEVTFGLKHFSDVITKRKLEMLPDNGTIVFESIANIHKAIKPYCSRSTQLTGAVKNLCTALAMLIRLCDEITAVSLRADAGNEELDTSAAALSPEHVSSVVKGVTSAVEEVAALAHQHMARPALSPRPALVSPRASTQRNSLPDIPLTPKERSLLTGEAGGEGGAGGACVRASHSSESILDAPDSPPPKPARPNRKIELAPPLPPKRKSANDSFLALSIDRLSLQSHSSGSLDSMLNVSNDEERNSHGTNNHDSVFTSPPNSDLVVVVCDATDGMGAGMCSCGGVGVGVGAGVGAGAGAGPGVGALGNDARISVDSHESHLTAHSHAHSHSNHNRFSNESGFVSVGHAEMSQEHSFTSSFSSHLYSSHSDRLASITSDEIETPPELPAKTRRNFRADVQQFFPNVEIRGGAVCAHEARPHTLAAGAHHPHHAHHPPRPPPLPLKKKHMFQSVAYSVMAYMEMFGNCSHPPNSAAVAPPDMFRHSIHTYNLASAQHSSAGVLSVQRHQQVQRSIAQSYTVQHFGNPPLSGSEDSVNITSSTSPVPPEPPALPPKMSKKQVQIYSSNELLPPPSPRPSSHNSSCDETIFNNNSEDTYVSTSTVVPGKFPLEDELEMLELQPTPSPVPSQISETSAEPVATMTEPAASPAPPDTEDIILQTDISSWLVLKVPSKDGPEVRGGNPDALIVLATKATKDFAYQEAFLATYRTWVSPSGLVARLVRRARHFRSRTHELRSTLSLLTRVVADLTMADLDCSLMQEIMEFNYWLVDAEELAIAKALRQIIVDKQKQLHFQQTNSRYEYAPSVSLRRDTLLDFKANELAEQMTLLDAELFVSLTTAEVLSWPRDQSEESSPNLTRFTEHFNKMSYWARSRILEQEEVREREKYASKFLKVMKALRKMNNFNSYLALVSALDSPPVRRLGWPRSIADTLIDYCTIIDSSSSFRTYRQALAETQPPCIPYIGLVLQDLTFVHIGNPDLLPDGSINFTKRWQQYHIMENMKKFHKERQYKFKKNERIQAMFNEFDDVLSEEAMWQISESIKPRGGRSRAAPAPAPVPTPAPTPAPPPAHTQAAA